MPTVDPVIATHPYVWRWEKGPDGLVRKGQRCRVIAGVAGETFCAVEFADGSRHIGRRCAMVQARRVDASEYPARSGHATAGAPGRGRAAPGRVPGRAAGDGADPKHGGMMYANTTRVWLGARCIVRVGDLAPAAVARLKRMAEWPNPEYAAKQRRGLWLGNTPPVLRAWRETGGGRGLSLPRGLYASVPDALTDAGVPCDLDRDVETDWTVHAASDRITPLVPLRPYQDRAVRALCGGLHGLCVFPCGGGKTVAALHAIARTGQARALVLVHTSDLVAQWVGAARTVLGIEAARVGGGEKAADRKAEPTARVVVATVQAAASALDRDPDAARAWLATFGVVVLDEAHHAPARTFARVLDACPALYRWGLTATPDRPDGLAPLLHAYLGPIVARVTREELCEAGASVRGAVVRVDTACAAHCPDMSSGWSRLVDDLCADPARNALIRDLAIREVQDGHTVLILTQRVEHAATLAAAIEAHPAVVPCAAVTGAQTAKERAQALDDLRTGALRCAVATQLADEGLDVPGLDRAILATPSRAAGRTVQRLGRILRPAPGKGGAVLYDLVDPLVTADAPDGTGRVLRPLVYQWQARRRAYRAELGANWDVAGEGVR